MIRLLLALALAAGPALAVEPSPVDYPLNYRYWPHVKSMVILPGHPLHESLGGLHHIYANDEAIEGYRTGNFPDGAIIVFDLLVAERTDDNAIVAGDRKLVGVMEKASYRFPESGGWGFEGFVGGDPGQRIDAGARIECATCHVGAPGEDRVFSTWLQ